MFDIVNISIVMMNKLPGWRDDLDLFHAEATKPAIVKLGRPWKYPDPAVGKCGLEKSGKP